MVQSGLFIIFLDTSSGHPYQSACAPVLVHFSVDVVVPPAVKQNVSIVMSGDVRGPTAEGRDGNKSVMINTTPANAPADSPAHTVTCKLETLKF